MNISRRSFLTGCLSAGALALIGCGNGPYLHRQRWFLFGTLVDVTLLHPEPERVRTAFGELAALLGDMHRNLHAWKPGALMDINRAFARGESLRVNSAIRSMVADLQMAHQRSRGAFNPAAGKLVRLWGFHDDVMPGGELPSRQAIERLLADAPTPADLIMEDETLSSRNPHVQLDLGGYGKGYALDAGMALLRRAGISDAVINAGGDLNIAGRNQGEAWRIGIRDPEAKRILSWLKASGEECIYTSGNYERFFEYQGHRYSHIVDPRDGMPVKDIVSATVVHRNGRMADAAATAISVAGPNRWQEVAEAMDLKEVMVVHTSGRVEVTRAMAERLSKVARKNLVVV